MDDAGLYRPRKAAPEVANESPADDLGRLRSIQADPHRGFLLRLLWEAGGMEVEASTAAMKERELCEKAYELLSGKRWVDGRP